MKIHIRQIKIEGLKLVESLSSEWIGLTRKDSIHFIVPVDIRANVTRGDDEVFVQIEADSRYECFCYRCLEDVENNWAANFTLSFEIDKHEEFIDISEDVRQELILNLPTRILCRDNCKGLCIDCGVNLNKQECQHEHSVASNTL